MTARVSSSHVSTVHCYCSLMKRTLKRKAKPNTHFEVVPLKDAVRAVKGADDAEDGGDTARLRTPKMAAASYKRGR